jgi:four helix bundle protein
VLRIVVSIWFDICTFECMANDRSQDIRDRSFEFGCRAARAGAFGITSAHGTRCLVDQLVRAGTSVGANLEEAKAASSRREFLRYVQVALREAREAVYWIRICLALRLGSVEDLQALREEGDELTRVLAAIVISTRRRMPPR